MTGETVSKVIDDTKVLFMVRSVDIKAAGVVEAEVEVIEKPLLLFEAVLEAVRELSELSLAECALLDLLKPPEELSRDKYRFEVPFTVDEMLAERD